MLNPYYMLFHAESPTDLRPLVRTALWCGPEYRLAKLALYCQGGYGALYRYDVVDGALLNERLVGVLKAGENEGDFLFTPPRDLTSPAV